MLYNQPVNTYYYLLDYLVFVAKKKPDDKSEIVVGGIITFIARKMGVGEENGINKIEGNIRLKLDTFTSMLIIRPYGPSLMYQYELRLPRANFMFILPNPTRTDSGVAENFLYDGSNPQVQYDDGGDEEEDAHFHNDSVHH